MPKVSDFHNKYMENKESFDNDAINLSKMDFMKKYHIGSERYDLYFRGMSKHHELRKLEFSNKRLKAMEKMKKLGQNLSDVRDFNYQNEHAEKVAQLAKKFDLPDTYILKLNKDYTLSEIESGEKVGKTIVVGDKYVMSTPTGWRESMFSFQSGMI